MNRLISTGHLIETAKLILRYFGHSVPKSKPKTQEQFIFYDGTWFSVQKPETQEPFIFYDGKWVRI